MKTIRLLTILALITSAACSADSNEPQQTYPTYETPDSGRPDLGVEDQGGNTPTEDMGLPLADMGEAEQDMPRVEPDMDMMRVDLGTPGPDDKTIRGRFESAGPVQTCGSVVSWTSPDGFLLRPRMNVCGDDANALGDTILANLNAAAEKGSRVMLVISQGIELPASWLDECESFAIESGRFTGKTCAPWDSKYQGLLREALVETIGPKVKGHEALAGVYFTISSMTNGAEMHLRIDRESIANYPGDDVMRRAYIDVMGIFQEAFEVPVVFEAGHCLWMNNEDCQTPLELYKATREKYGVESTGVAMWNCSERFFVSDKSPEFGAREIFEIASADGASIGCQTVGAFEQACRFTSEETANYGTSPSGPGSSDCPDSTAADVEAACVDTVNWFIGKESKNEKSPVINGTWGEFWSRDLQRSGAYQQSSKCKATIDMLEPRASRSP